MLELTVGIISDFALAICTLFVMLAAVAAWWRQKPYTRKDFSEAMERICEGASKLCSLQDEVLFCRSAVAGAALKAECYSILKDMLQNTCFIVERADACFSSDLSRNANDAEIHRRANVVVRRGLPLILRVRWSLLRLGFSPAPATCQRTLDAAQDYARLWSAVIGFLEARFPGCRERLAAAV